MKRTIEISEETFQKLKDQLTDDDKLIDINDLSELIGKNVFFKTVTYHYLGKVVKQFGNFIELQDASWIADSGRFMNFVKDGIIDEVEPVGQWFINIHSVTDFGIWRHQLPMEQK